MTSSVSTKLSGTLGERHRCFNALVHEAYQQNTPLSVPHPEEAAVDRLFKIDLASKQRNVDFIIHTLKDDDLLYVNRALKSLWLLEPEYSNIMNPIFIEDELFPHMTLPAVKKLRHWIQMHLRDPQRCTEFYRFYKSKNFNIAAKFLWHCSNEYVLSEISNVMDKITPKLLKRISEKVPQITKIYYDSLKENQTLLKYYLENDTKFFANVKYLLKTDVDIFFHVLENFFVSQKFCSFNDEISKYIIKNYKSRFILKPELYTAWFLDMDALARCLSSEEIKNLVLKLARAEYLQSWFSYQKVEPLIKRLSKEERVAFKNLVFVDKAFGPIVKEWPYPIPSPPILTSPQTNLFEDTIKDPYHILSWWCDDGILDFRCMLKKRKYRKCWGSSKTLLDQLFDKYRFYNFKMTLLELRKQLRAESSPQNREFMLLVLISKTGGKTENVVTLLDLLSRYKNEPVHIRATIVRSLVKRAFVWRLPVEHWTRLLEWGHGLGLDGSPSEANCFEGLHAVVIRNLLADVKPSASVWESFLTNYFDNLHGYSLNVDERSRVRARLPALLLTTVQSNPGELQLTVLKYLLDTLEAYHIQFDDLPGVVEAVAATVKYDSNVIREEAQGLLIRLYDAGVARKLLIRENFEIIQTDASYINALRHDISILDKTDQLEKLIQDKTINHKKFFCKLALYFTEKGGLGERYCTVLKLRAATAPDITLARPLALLCGSTFPSILKVFDAVPPKTPQRQLASALRSNAHVVRPTFDLEYFGWRQAGAKAVANRVATCRQRDVERYLQDALTWRRTQRLALVLAKRVHKERDVFEVLASQRPGTALQAALRYFRHERDSSDPRIWELVKSHISKCEERQLRACINFKKSVPAFIKAEYCFLVYMACKQNLKAMEGQALAEIPSILHKLDETYIFNAIDTFLQDYFTDCENLKKTMGKNAEFISLYIEIAAKFLILSTSEKMLEERYRRVALPFLNRVELFWKQVSPDDVPIEFFLDSFLFYLRYNKVYFDVKYVSCLPVFENITKWMHGFLPIAKWFDKYVAVHLTMIYFKSVRHCLKQDSSLFSGSRTLEGAYMLGTIFGTFLANEIEELILKYFPTVIELYASELDEYFSVYYTHQCGPDESIEKFKVGVLNGLLASNSVSPCVFAKHMFMKFRNCLNSEHVKYILNKFHESEVDGLCFAIDND